MIEFTKLHLSKQAEVIAEKAEFINVSTSGFVTIDKNGIIQASDEYINNLK